MSRTAIWIANGALLVLCCFLAARMITDIVAETIVPPAASAAAIDASAAQSPRRNPSRAILGRNLFNVSTLAPTVVEEPEPDVYEKTKLPLRLLGTAAGDPTISWAAVEDLESREHLVLRLEDRVKNQATVVKIERRRIVFDNGGRLEELLLDEEEAEARPSNRRRASRDRSDRRRESRRRRQARDNSRNSRIERLAENRFAVPRSDVENVANNPATLFSQARILPKYEGGEMVGVQLNAIKPGSLFEDIGIKNGDIITEFNGIKVTSQQESAQVLRELTAAKSFQVTVKDSAGASRELEYELR